MMKQVKFRIPLRMMAVLFGLVLSIGAYAQITVNGHVKDATGEPIIGATVRVAGSEGGTVTDFDGNRLPPRFLAPWRRPEELQRHWRQP